jgi:hypothetical protein
MHLAFPGHHRADWSMMEELDLHLPADEAAFSCKL